MDSLYFSAMIIGIAWLAVWSAIPEGLPFASPFDMLRGIRSVPDTVAEAGTKPAPMPRVADATAPRTTSARSNSAPSWRQRTRPRRAEATAAELPAAPPEPRQAVSWRTRRPTAAPGRRRR